MDEKMTHLKASLRALGKKYDLDPDQLAKLTAQDVHDSFEIARIEEVASMRDIRKSKKTQSQTVKSDGDESDLDLSEYKGKRRVHRIEDEKPYLKMD